MNHPIPKALREAFSKIEDKICIEHPKASAVFTEMRTAATVYFESSADKDSIIAQLHRDLNDRDEQIALLSKQAEQHQGDPVALPEKLPACKVIAAGWNQCLDVIAKLGPLYSRHVHSNSDPIVGVLKDCLAEGVQPTFSGGDLKHLIRLLERGCADPGEVDLARAREDFSSDMDSMRDDMLIKALDDNERLSAQLAKRDELLRDKSGELIRMAAHLISAPLFALQDLQDEDKKMTRARVDRAVDVADARLKDAAYDLRRIADALSASAAVERKP